MWSERYNQSNEPTMANISNFVNNELWDELCKFIETSYACLPRIEYSKCSMQRGWNVKYKKGGKSLCTLYPMEGFFIALVVIGEKEQLEAEFLMTNCSDYIQKLYHNTPFSCGGRWLMIEITKQEILDDVMELIQIRSK